MGTAAAWAHRLAVPARLHGHRLNPHLISTVILIGHWLLVIGLSVRVITRRFPVGVAVAWLAIMFSLPLVGAVAYLLLGEKRLGRRHRRHAAAAQAALRVWQQTLPAPGNRPAGVDQASELQRLARTISGFPPQSGHQVRLLDHCSAIFDVLIADIDSARQCCHLSFYIWHAEGRMADVLGALRRAAERGLDCRALADALGSREFLASPAAQALRQAGVDLRATLPGGLLGALWSRIDLRNHRKIAVIDGRVAYAGSQNLVDPAHFRQSAGVGEWVDAMLRITGPAAQALDAVFEFDWSAETGAAFRGPVADIQGAAGSDGTVLQLAPSGPDLQPEVIHDLLLAAIYGARQSIAMTTPYFVPDDALLTALLTAARRGVEVCLIVPARNDSRMVRLASASCFEPLLAAGVSIALFRGGLLHTKSLVIDRSISVFGSVNLDMRSFWLNFEISLLVYDADFAAQLRHLQQGYLLDSDRVDLAIWRQRPRSRQFAESAFRLLGPLL